MTRGTNGLKSQSSFTERSKVAIMENSALIGEGLLS